jgi:hypothetical protein
VVALDPRYGATTVARGLAAALAGLDSGGVAVVTGAPSSRALGSSGARRLSRTLAPLVGPTKAIGRLCFADAADPSALLDAVRHLAPVVLDAGPASRAAAVAPRADAVVLVASGRAEPALAAVVARSLSRIGPVPWCVVERGDPERWSGRDAIVLPTTRLGARRVRRGAPAGGEMGRALTELAERCGAAS